MKTKLFIIPLLLTFLSTQAQDDNFKKLEFDASVNFWTPSALQMKAINSVTQIYYDNNYYSTGDFGGFGTSIVPAFNLTYYFKNDIGISLGFYPLSMDNELHVQTTDSTTSNYENYASISNLTLGVSGRLSTSEAFSLYYGTGINYVPNYDLTITTSTESTDPPDLDALGSAVGFYFKTGIKFKVYKFLSINTGFDYTFIPCEIEFTSNDGVKINEKTNLGGFGFKAGLTFSFLNSK